MVWLAENWVWVLVGVAFIGLHLFGHGGHGGMAGMENREMKPKKSTRAAPALWQRHNDHVTKTGKRRTTAIDGRTTRHPGYAVSLRVRKRVEEIFGWMKTTGVLRKTRHRGKDSVGWMFTLTATA